MAKEEHARLYFGRSGQLAVMSELLYRRRNTAIPEVDVGDDVFVVRDEEDKVTRVQVKAANANPQHGGYFAQFNVPLLQLKNPKPPLFVYIFPVRWEGRWADFIIIHRSTLNRLRVKHKIGSLSQGNLVLRLAFTATDVWNKSVSFQPFRNAWDPWPPLALPV
jgi:hypothetical protein